MVYSLTGSSDLFWSSNAWPSPSCTWAFLLCILILYGELIPLSLLNWISPLPSQIRPVSIKPPSNDFEINKPGVGGGGFIEDWRPNTHKILKLEADQEHRKGMYLWGRGRLCNLEYTYCSSPLLHTTVHANSPGHVTDLLHSRTGHHISRMKSSFEVFCASPFLAQNLNFSYSQYGFWSIFARI